MAGYNSDQGSDPRNEDTIAVRQSAAFRRPAHRKEFAASFNHASELRDVPLFLAEQRQGAADEGFDRLPRTRRIRWQRIAMSSAIAATAALVVATLIPADVTRAAFTHAKSSLAGVTLEQPTTPALNPLEEPVTAASTVAKRAEAETTKSQPLATTSVDETDALTPSRARIEAAWRSALRANVPSEAPAQNEVGQIPARHIDAAELAAMLERAKGMVGIGDIAAARLLLERAANAGEAHAALLLAQTYDSEVLGAPNLRSVTADSNAARRWYEKAVKLGSADAKSRLSSLQK